MNKILKNTVILTIITLVSGVRRRLSDYKGADRKGTGRGEAGGVSAGI